MATASTAAVVIPRGTSNAAFAQLTGCSVTRSGTTATLTKTSHGLSNGDAVLIQGFDLEEFNGVFTVANSAANTFDYTIKQDPGANPAATPGTVDKVTLGTAVDCTTAYDGRVFGGLQNGQSAPGVAPQVWIGESTTSTEADYVWRALVSGDVTVKSWTPIGATLRPGLFTNFCVCRNTTNAVDVQLNSVKMTAV